MLDITPGPYQGWLSEELERFTYLCVEKDTDLEGPRLDGVLGRVTRAGMRTAPNRRVIKADAPRRYRWIGRDNSALRAELKDELDGLQRQFDDVTRQVEIARGVLQAQQGRIDELNRLRDDLSWEDLDLEPTTRRLAALAGELDRVDSPEQRGRRAAYDTAQQGLFGARRATEQAQQNVERLNRLWGAVLRAQDAANDIVDAHEPLTADELAAAASLPFKAPTLDKIDLGGRDVDEKTDAAVRASYLDAASIVEDQIRADDLARASHERTLLATIRAYRNINDRTHREIDDAIESLAALEQIHKQLVTDDLPRTRRDWLKRSTPTSTRGCVPCCSRSTLTAGRSPAAWTPSTPSWAGCRSGTTRTWRSSRLIIPTATCRSSGRSCWPLPGTTRWGRTCSTTRPRSRPPSGGYARAWSA